MDVRANVGALEAETFQDPQAGEVVRVGCGDELRKGDAGMIEDGAGSFESKSATPPGSCETEIELRLTGVLADLDPAVADELSCRCQYHRQGAGAIASQRVTRRVEPSRHFVSADWSAVSDKSHRDRIAQQR